MESPKILLCSAQPELISEWAQALSPIATLIECTQLGRLNDLVRIRKPDMIIFHIEGQLHRIDEAVGVVLEHEDTQVLVLDVMPNDEDGVVLLKAGVRGYANESLAGSLMQNAIQSIRAGDIWVSRRIMQTLVDELLIGESIGGRMLDPRLDKLSHREREIAELVAEGNTNKEVAIRLNITERTVKAHMTNCFQKTGTKDRLGLSLLIRGELPLEQAV